MSFITTPQNVENAFRIQMSGDPALADMYLTRPTLTPNQPAEELSHAGDVAVGQVCKDESVSGN